MALDHSIPITLYWGNGIRYENGSITTDESSLTSTIIIEKKLHYYELIDLIYANIGLEKSSFKLKLTLVYKYRGGPKFDQIRCETSLQILYFLAEKDENYWAEVHVEIEKITHEEVLQTCNTSLVDFLCSFTNPGSVCGSSHINPPPLYMAGPSTQPQPQPQPQSQPIVDRSETNIGFGEQEDSQSGEEEIDTFSNIGEDSDDNLENNPTENVTIQCHSYSERVMKFMNDVGDGNDDMQRDNDNIHIDFWDKSRNEIRIGMRFKSKKQLKEAIMLWSIAQNREFKVVESRFNTWAAKCRDVEEQNCEWYVRGLHKKIHQQWQITKWVCDHNCIGASVGNNNKNLTSTLIASYIRHSIEEDPEYSVKSIQADIKNLLNVDVSYKKAWHGRRKALEAVYGTWESNFAELPSYVAALKTSNPNTIVNWFHHPNSSSNVMTFKYVFWAFGPSIEAFRMCRPVVCVDGTHLCGSYKGKMLVAVSKDANNRILPVAYAIVDEETVHSWSWFFEQFRYYIAPDRQLCVISDRHRGIIHAMENLEGWKEPFAYHRFCLRHIRSNLMSKFKNLSLKRLCWAIASTTQERKFFSYKSEIQAINHVAWNYLEEIDRSQWCLAFDNNRRWGSLTTNTSESFNNVLRGARQLPIRACMELTFKRTVQLFKSYSITALNCKTALPPNIWKIFRKADTHAQAHQIEEFDYRKGVYKVITSRKVNGRGGNVQIVHYYEQKCTCGKWQTHRFPCSHAICVCRNRRDNPMTLVNEVYSISTFRSQYASDFIPLPHVEYWEDPGWKLQGDDSKVYASRGRKRRNRIRNEMDQRHPDEPRRCGICKCSGHNQRSCPNSQPRFDDI